MLGASFIAGCSVPCEDAPARVYDLPAVTWNDDEEVRFTFYDRSGDRMAAFALDHVPETARAAVEVHVPGKTVAVPPGDVVYGADLRGDQARTARLMPRSHLAGRAHAAQAGAWAAESLRIAAGLAASESTRPLLHEPPRMPDLDRLPEAEKLRAAVEMAPSLNVSRVIRTHAAHRPRLADFDLDSSNEGVILYCRAGCASCEVVRQRIDSAGVRVERRDPEENEAARESLDFLADAAGREDPAVPALFLSGRLMVGSPGSDLSELFHVKHQD